MREAEEEGDGNNTETSILDGKPMRVFGHPLTITQQMWLGFLVPATISTIIFILNFALDVAVTYQLFRDGQELLAAATILLIYAPPMFCLVLTLLNRPKLDSIWDRTAWIFIQILQFLLFPIGIIHRFASRLFWSISALTDKDPAREQALHVAAAGHQTELFFFIDAFLHAAPQAVIQAYILLSPQIYTSVETAWTQAISIVASVLSLSKTVALYQRYESQKVVGRPVPWAVQHTEAHARALVNITKLDPYFLMGFQKKDKVKATQETEAQIEISHAPEENEETEIAQHEETEHNENSSLERAEPQCSQLQEAKCCTSNDPGSGDQLLDSKTNPSEEPNEKDALLPTTENGTGTGETSHYLVPASSLSLDIPLEDRCFWPRIVTPPSTPTADPHMRPRLSVNTLMRNPTIPIIPINTSNIALPIRKPRTKGLNEDEPLGIFTVFNAWLTYLTARVLVIAAFLHFYPWPALGLILSHYTIMVAYLCFCKPCPNLWAPLLGYVYILCPIEVKVQFKHPRIFLISFFALVLLEDLATVILWYYGAEWETWWYDYAFFFIIGCHCIAAVNASLYLFLFKPETKYLE